MKNWLKRSRLSLVGASVLAFASAQGCEAVNDATDDGSLPGLANQLAEQCGLTCPDRGILDGNASISGVANVDAFFASVVNFNAAANGVSSNIEAQLAKIRTSLELDADASAADIVAQIEARYELDGGLQIAYQPAQCSVSAEATIEAAARCDAEIDPGSAKVECKGSCEVEASAEIDCGASAELKCVGTAPNLECEGSCQGTCELSAAAECEGTCQGSCDGECSVVNADGTCAGTCKGKCEGSCELSVAASCEGQCKGECTYTPPSGKCEANASAHCEAKGEASIECKGRCDGEITPPSVKAECQASAKAEAELNVECTPPSVDVRYAFKADADAQVKAEFEAFLVRFRGNLSALLQAVARAEVVAKAGVSLQASATAAVKSSVKATASGDLSTKEAIGLACALSELDNVKGAITASASRLSGNIQVAGSLTAELTKS